MDPPPNDILVHIFENNPDKKIPVLIGVNPEGLERRLKSNGADRAEEITRSYRYSALRIEDYIGLHEDAEIKEGIGFQTLSARLSPITIILIYNDLEKLPINYISFN